jgi:hypothetical protein
MTAPKPATRAAAQEVCIDLPGEAVKCWRSSDHLQVLLRKPRDVIFHLHLKAGVSYSVQATDTDFYNARDKKLVQAKRRDLVTFKDGERLHLWLPRNFKGALLLKSDGNLLMKLAPNQLDPHWYDDNPKTKAAPIIVAMGLNNAHPPATSAPAAHPVVLHAAKTAAAPRPVVASSAPAGDQCSLVCVVEGTVKGMPSHLASHFSKGGGKSGMADFDPFEVATRNWIWGQAAGSAAFVGDNWKWLRASMDSRTHTGFKFVKARMVMVRGKLRFYFSGYSKYNEVFGRGGFNPGNERVVSIFSGAGKTSSTFTAAAKGVAGSFKGNALVSFIFGAATAVAEWKEDVKKDGYDLTAGLLMALLKAIIVAALVVVIMALMMMFIMAAATASVPVLLVGVITVAVGVGVNWVVEAADKSLGRAASGDKTNTDGLSSVVAPYLRKAGKEIGESWDYLKAKFPKDYMEFNF